MSESERLLYKIELPWGSVWTPDYDHAYQEATGERLATGSDTADGEERITAFGLDPRTVECVYCEDEVSYSLIANHHTREHPGKRFAHFYYPEVYEMEVSSR